MSKIYQITVTTSVDRGGVGTYLTSGDAIEVEGQRYARLAHGTLVQAGDGWHDTLQAAQAAAAEQIDAIGRKVLEQAACLREASRG